MRNERRFDAQDKFLSLFKKSYIIARRSGASRLEKIVEKHENLFVYVQRRFKAPSNSTPGTVSDEEYKG